MELLSDWLADLGGWTLATATRAWMGALDFRAAYYDPSVDPGRDDHAQRAIYLFWHEYITFPMYLRGHCQVAMLASLHRDAEWVVRAGRRLGFDVVRGSSRRGGAAALRQLIDISRRRHLAITPDGPRGPRRQLASGAIYLASRLQLPLVLMGFGYDAPYRLPTWDRHALPRLGSRARAVVSPRIWIPPALSRADLEAARGDVERLLNDLTGEAEQWAASGARGTAEHLVFPSRMSDAAASRLAA